MIGESLLFGVVAGYGERARRVYLPKGRWVDYHSLKWYESQGEATSPIQEYRTRDGQDGVFTLRLFARAGAIIPLRYVDEHTRNLSGMRSVKMETLTAEESQRKIQHWQELRLKVFAGATPTSFTLFEDDALAVDYLSGKVRETQISQQGFDDSVKITVHGAAARFHDAVMARSNMVELVVDGKETTAV